MRLLFKKLFFFWKSVLIVPLNDEEELATIGRLPHAACLCANGLLGRILGTTLVRESRKEDLAMGKHLRLGWPFSDALIIGR